MNVAVLALAALALLAPAHAASAPAQTASAPQPPVGHVFTIVLENKDYARTFGKDTEAPYLARTLAGRGALLPNYFATGHLSLDNYLTMISGQAPNALTQADCPVFTNVTPGLSGPEGQALGAGCVHPARVKTVADQLEAAGKTWRGYMEDMGHDPGREARTCGHPAIGARDTTQGATAKDQYATRHDPFVYFHSILDDRRRCDAGVVNLDELPADLADASRTPSYSFITPDLCSDGHDATCADARQPGGYAGIEAFLKTWVPRITSSPAFKKDGLLLITFDEGEADSGACCAEPAGPNTARPGIRGPGGGRVGAVALSPFVKPGTVVATPIDHYGYLRSVEDLFGLDHLGYAARDGLATFQSMGALRTTRVGAGRAVKSFEVPRRITGRRLVVRVRLASGVAGRITVRRAGAFVAGATIRGSRRKRFDVGARRGRYVVTLRATRDGMTVARRSRVSRRR